ncbi:MAG TPA: DUF3795 domain-containing protein [Candidatus Cloacimonadota bacterium]|nr:DUF3795 domain-containing protein [Candidatus Cloacimonadota bacterium]HPT72535.1 DUF3795 domain-containing protein [Candidatus Cloacimonadota bacterium]
MLSICGVNCRTDCHAFGTECIGCNELDGKVSWAVFYGKSTCPIYDCAMQKGLSSCGKCSDAPCKIWYETRNPDASDEEFEEDIASRMKNLNS